MRIVPFLSAIFSKVLVAFFLVGCPDAKHAEKYKGESVFLSKIKHARHAGKTNLFESSRVRVMKRGFYHEHEGFVRIIERESTTEDLQDKYGHTIEVFTEKDNIIEAHC